MRLNTHTFRMGSKTFQLVLRATPPAAARVISRNKRFFAVRSSLEPPNVERLAETARISLTPQQQVEEFAPKIRQVVDWFGQLQAVDLQSVEPAIRADTEGDNLRSDAPEIFDNRDAIIALIPSYEDSYIKVPQVRFLHQSSSSLAQGMTIFRL